MESQQRSNMVPMSVIATDICQNFGDTTRKYFGDHLVNLINAFKDLHIFLRNEVAVKSVILPLDGIIELPCNFIRETKVGVINDQGRIAVMSVDRKLRIPVPIITNTQVEDLVTDIFNEEIGSPDLPFYNCPLGTGFGELYGNAKSINTLGYFNVNRTDNVLLVSPSIPSGVTNIVMEYITDGVSDGIKLVPSELVNCLTNKAKAMFCLDKSDPRSTTYDNNHMLQFKQVKRMYLAKPIDFYAEIFKQHHQSSPK